MKVYAMKPASRSLIDPFMAMEAVRDAQALSQGGADVLHLSVGQPATPLPERVRQKIGQLFNDHPQGYTDARGLPALRARIARHYQEQYGLALSPDRVVVTVGSSAAYFMALMSAFDHGDEVALVAPHYAASPNMMLALGLKPVILHSTMADNFQPTVAMLKALPRAPKGLVIASPSNPTGTVIDPAELKALAAYCEANGICIISDEIYHGVSYDGLPTPTMLEYSSQMIVTNSFSKYYLMPGWRLGWAVLPEPLLRPCESLLQNFFISAPSLSQYVGLEMMDCRSELDAVVQGYDANRKRLIEGLEAVGITRLSPAQGAFYIYADISDLASDSREFCQRLLHEAHISAVSGIDFDKTSGQNYVRFSYCASLSTIEQACKRLQEWL